MFRKRIMIISILLIVAIGAISCVSAADANGTDQLADGDSIEVTKNNELSNDNVMTDPTEKTVAEPLANATLTPTNLEGGYKAGVATVKLTDSNNNPLADQKIRLIVVGKISSSSSSKTDANGTASFKFSDLHYAELNGTDINRYDLTIGKWPVKFELDSGEYAAKAVSDTLTVKKTTANIQVSNVNADFGENKNFTITLTDSATGAPIAKEVLRVNIASTADGFYNFITDSEGKCQLNVNQLLPGTYPVTVTLETDNIRATPKSANIVINKIPVTLKADKLTTTYKSGETFKITVVNNNVAFGGVKLKLKVYTGSNYETFYVITNENGTAVFDTSGLSKGTHKVVVSNTDTMFSAKSLTSSIVINPKKLTIVGTSKKLKDSGQLILKAKDKTTGKFVSGIKLQVKVFTGKKYKTFNLVTKKAKELSNAIGVLLKTNKFSVGTHKVTVKVTSPNYKGSGTFKLTIPKTAQNYKKFTYVVSNGKGKYV